MYTTLGPALNELSKILVPTAYFVTVLLRLRCHQGELVAAARKHPPQCFTGLMQCGRVVVQEQGSGSNKGLTCAVTAHTVYISRCVASCGAGGVGRRRRRPKLKISSGRRRGLLCGGTALTLFDSPSTALHSSS